MTPLEQQVREALQNDPNTAMYSREDILTALRPLLEQQAAAVATLTAERDAARELARDFANQTQMNTRSARRSPQTPRSCLTCKWAGDVVATGVDFPEQECSNPKFGGYWVMPTGIGCTAHEPKDGGQ